MSSFLSVKALDEKGTPKKEIARRLGHDPRTVRKWIKRIRSGTTEPLSTPRSGKLDFLRDTIEAKVRQGLSAIQIWQDLDREVEGFSASYETVKRLVRRLRPEKRGKVYARLVHLPGEEAQIDFAEVGRFKIDGRMRRAYLFCMTLCYSRMTYYDVVSDQTVPTFLSAIARAFDFFGGVPKRIKPDNLRAAVLIDRLGQRLYQEDFFRFCQHHGTVADAARPYTPTDKGQVERDIRYCRSSCLRGRDFDSFEAMRDHVRAWPDEVANVRVHATLGRRPVDLLEEERGHLLPLPEERFEAATWGLFRVRKDCHVQVMGSFYSVPHEHVGDRVAVRLTEDQVEIHACGSVIARHSRARGRGATVTDEGHYPPTKRLATQEIRRRRIERVRSAGPSAAEFLKHLREGRMVFADQLARMDRLCERFGPEALESACRRALHFDATGSTMTLERILERGLQDRELRLVEGPVEAAAGGFARPLAEYAALLDSGRAS